MTSLLVALITGLTTGGLSCMAVQGGLLASSLANQIEQDVRENSSKKHSRGSFRVALPIVLFLVAKLVAYTALGALLGGLGEVVQVTPTAQAILQFVIAFFMIGNALRMLKVHPIFRFFTFEPPPSVTRFLRKRSKKAGGCFTPLFLGALTVLIPCGVTQTMMAAAVATGDPLQGAALLFAFVLGTSPVFFVLSYFATRLGAMMEKYLMRFVAAVLIILGVVALNTGLNLLGSPVSLSRLVNLGSYNTTSSLPESLQQPLEGQSAASDVITLHAVDNGYRPKRLHAPAGVPITLNVVTNETYSCSRAFLIPMLDYGTILDATGTEVVEIPAQTAGTVMPFTCSMGMYTGEIIFDL